MRLGHHGPNIKYAKMEDRSRGTTQNLARMVDALTLTTLFSVAS